MKKCSIKVLIVFTALLAFPATGALGHPDASPGAKPEAQVSPPPEKPAPNAPPAAQPATPVKPTPPSAQQPAQPETSPPAEPGTIVAGIRSEAESLRSLLSSESARAFLGSAADLPAIAPRTLYHDAAKSRYWSESDAASLPEGERAALQSRVFDEDFYYNTRYGTPLAYARPLDLLGVRGFQAARARVFDFGYGGIGQLRMLASIGADVVGVEVNPIVRALYSYPGDQGSIKGQAGVEGRLSLVYGSFPAEGEVKAAVGESFDLILSKNVLKRGYIHPEQPVPDAQKVILGVEDGVFVETLFAILKPGGMMMIYNLSPAPNTTGKPYRPWADGRCPFPREMWEAAGFRVIAFDEDDSEMARAMAHALGWDAGPPPMDLVKDLFAQYTLVVKPGT